MMTDKFYDSQGVPTGGYDTPLNRRSAYDDFVHVPTPAERANHEGRVAYNSAMLDALAEMPDRVKVVAHRSVSLLMDGPVACGQTLGRLVQNWRAMAEADAKAAVLRGDYGEEGMNYAIMMAAARNE